MTFEPNPQSAEASKRDILAAHAFIHPGKQIVELRPKGTKRRYSGFYDDPQALACHAAGNSADDPITAVYWTLHKLNDTPIPVSNTLARAGTGRSTGNKHVVAYNVIFLDFDPNKPEAHKDDPSTDAEHAACIEVAHQVNADLRSQGFPEPMILDSGNGCYLIYATDLPTDLKLLVKAFTEAISAKYSNELVNVDRSVWGQARISRVPGTMNRKGTASEERPYRWCRILSLPTTRELVTAEMLSSIAPTVTDETASQEPLTDIEAAAHQEEQWLKARGAKYIREETLEPEGRVIRFRFASCPFRPGQDDGRAYLQVHETRGISAGCFHGKCMHKRLTDLRRALGGWTDDDTIESADGLPARVSDPHRLARCHVDRFGHSGQPTIIYRGEDLLVWENSLYRPTTDKEISPYICETIKREFDDRARKLQAKGNKGVPAKVTTGHVRDTLAALKSLAKLGTDKHSPCWLSPSPHDPADMIPFRNGLLHLPSFLDGEEDYFFPPSPAYFNRHVLDFEYDPAATAARWPAFLAELWDDEDCHKLLEEWGGYCLTRDTHLQKMMLLLGKTRGGKGTICTVLSKMVGDNVASPSLSSITSQFGLEPLLGKQLVILPDSRSCSAQKLEAVCERLKGITGEDTFTIDVKHKTMVTRKLQVKIVIQSNDALAIPDSSAALATRQLFLRFDRSFLGKEDRRLKDHLLAEMPGIANRFLAALQRLYENDGVFTEPESSRQLAEQISFDAIPLKRFLLDCCTVSPEHKVLAEDLRFAYLGWADEYGIEPLPKNQFGRELLATASTVTRTQDTKKNAKGIRPYWYHGIAAK